MPKSITNLSFFDPNRFFIYSLMDGVTTTISVREKEKYRVKW